MSAVFIAENANNIGKFWFLILKAYPFKAFQMCVDM